jgi:hypothetical protein
MLLGRLVETRVRFPIASSDPGEGDIEGGGDAAGAARAKYTCDVLALAGESAG